jgi:DNA helicase HerA-like ATPase
MFRKAERANREFPMMLVIDEAHELAPQSRKDGIPHRDAVRQLMKQGVKRNIKTVLISQQPVSLDKESVREAEYRLVFEMSHEAMRDFSKYGFDEQQIRENPKWTGVLHRATGEVIEPRVRAAEGYA